MPTDIYERFGASVHFGEDTPGLFMVISTENDPSHLIASYGGTVVLRFNGGNPAIARLTLPRALALQKEPSIRTVGGVHLDLDRYRALLESLGARPSPTGG